MFVGDITIDNIVFSNPPTIYLLTMDNAGANLNIFCISKYFGSKVVNKIERAWTLIISEECILNVGRC